MLRPRVVLGRVPVIVAGVVLAVLTLADAESVQGLPPVGAARLAGDVLVGVAALIALARPRWRLPVLAAAVGSGLLTVTVSTVVPDPPVLGAAELAGLLVAAALTMRFASGWWAPVQAAAVGAATLSGGLLRDTPGMGAATDLAYLALALGGAAAVGLWLRAADRDRSRLVEAARQAERLNLARELHDVVAHHVTGIVVQAQALRRVAATRPELAIDTLPQIEHAGTAALTAMRQLLTALRTPEEAAPNRTVDLRADLHRITEAAGVPARLHLALDHATLPTTIALTVERLVTETLTNAARYAPDATTVDIAVEARPDGVQVEVIDNGTGHATFPGGAGYGLVGLDERVRMLGGTLTAGPTNGAGGWRVSATLPLLEPS